MDEALLASAEVDPSKAGDEFRLLAATKFFELRHVTSGQASRLAGLSVWDFTEALQRLGFHGPI